MPVFGQYQTEGDADRSGLVLLWLARRAGEDGPPRYTLAVLPAQDDFGEPRPAHQTEAFLDAYRAQQAAAEAGGPDGGAVARIHEVGVAPDGAYAASDAFPRSVQKLAVGRVRLDGAGLRRIASGVIAGIKQFEAGGRPHGNLKPTNVLISAGDAATADVRVSEPAPLSALGADAGIKDRQDLGRLLYLLITFRPFRELGGWPIENGPEWERLGDEAELWRGLCNDLLNPHPAELPDADSILQRIAASAAVGGAAGASDAAGVRKRGPVIVAAAGLLAMGAGAAVWFSGVLGGSPAPVAPGPTPDPAPDPTPEVVVREPTGPDPRIGWDPEDKLGTLRRPFDELKYEAIESEQQTIQALEAELAAIRETLVPAVASLPWTAETEEDVRAKLREADERIAAYGQSLGDAIAKHKELVRDIDATDRLERVKARIRERDRIVEDSEVLNAAWVRWRDDLLSNPTLETLEPAERALRAGLLDLNEALGPPARAPLPGEVGERLRALAASRRERALEQAVSHLNPWRDGAWRSETPEFKQGWQSIRDEYAEWNEALAGVVEDFTNARELLDSAHLPDEPTAETGPGALVARWEEHEILAEVIDAAPELVTPVRNELTQVDAAARLSADEARALLGADAVRPAVARAAWVRLGEVDAEVSAAALARQIDLAGRTDGAMEGVGDPERREALRQGVREELRRRALALLAAFDTAPDVEAALDLIERAGLTDEDLRSLPAPAQYNLLLADLRARAPSLAGKEHVKELRQAVERFVAEVDSLGDLATRPGVAGPLEELKKLVAGAGPVSEEELAALGPGSVGWVAAVEPGAAAVTYTGPGPASGKPTVRFQRLVVPGPDGYEQTVYVAATEVSVGLFTAAGGMAGGTADEGPFNQLVTALSEAVAPGATSDPRTGPRTWQWRSRITPRTWLSLPTSWIAERTQDKETAWAQAIVKEASGEYPMQWVSPSAAAYTASLIGCRLPTEQEWRAAFALAGPTGANRRDAVWQALLTNVIAKDEEFRAAGRVPQISWPDEGVFWPDGIARHEREAAQAVESGSDGHLFFAKVDQSEGSPFRHLVGNVAEYIVVDGSEMPQTTPPTLPEIESALGPEYANVRVIGASAISAPELSPDRAFELDGTVARRGFSDVGFRLAFSAGSGLGAQLAEKVAAALSGAGYQRRE